MKNNHKIFTVTKKEKLLEFLIDNATMTPKKLKSCLTHGQVTVDGVVKTKYDTPLENGQTVCIKPFGLKNVSENKLLNIIYEDTDIIVINKPTALLTVSSDNENERTAFHLLSEYVKRGNKDNRVFVVHRLDKDTSGVVLFAKNEGLKNLFQENWDSLVKYRGYLAIVQGKPNCNEERIVSYLKENAIHKVYVSEKEGDGKIAVTNYRISKTNGKYSLLRVWIETGRKNQIRVQLNSIGCPIIGDKRYGASESPLCRLGLHADKLEIVHPCTGKLLKLEASAGHKFMTFIAKSSDNKQNSERDRKK